MAMRPPKTRSACGLAVLLGIGLGGCQKKVVEKVEPPPPEVFVAHPVTQTIIDFEEATGRLAPVKFVDVRARVTGYLDAVYFKDGDDVAEDAKLFQIDDRPYKAALAEAEAHVKQLESRYERNRRQEERLISLAEKKVTTAEDLDLAKFQRMETEAELEAARATVDLAELNVEFTQIKSPIDGRIGRSLVDPGNLVQADDTQLVTIVSLDPIYAYLDVDERTALQLIRMIAEGKLYSPNEKPIRIELGLADEEEYTIEGSLNFEDNQLSPTTGTLRLRAEVENKQKLLLPGMFVRIKVPIGEPREAILVKEESLGSDQGQKFVYIINDKEEVEYRRIKAGKLYSGLRVIDSGLNTEDRVIVKGLQRVRPGIKVTATPLKSPDVEQAGAAVRPPNVLVAKPPANDGQASKIGDAR